MLDNTRNQNLNLNLEQKLGGNKLGPHGNFNPNSQIKFKTSIVLKSILCDYSQLRHSGVFIFNFEHISHLFLEFLLLILNK